ncbi:MAG: TIGR04211 family SH3 domain-containing protein [Desulfobacterales bacterium]
MMMPLMKRFVPFGICLLLFAVPVHATTMYVNDIVEITLRTGKSLDHKILSFLQSGQRLEVLEMKDKWAHVRTSNGKDGWVLTRYLTPEPTSKIKLERLEEKQKSVMEQNAALLQENQKLKGENKKLSAALASTDKGLDQVRTEYETLKSESGEFLKLKAKYEKTATRLDEETLKASQLDEQVAKLTRSYAIKWFLAGSGVLLFGFIVGFSLKRQRRRPSLL